MGRQEVMDRQEILTRVKTVTAKQLGIDEAVISEESNFADLGADSLDLVELVIAFEEEFAKEVGLNGISDEDAEKLLTVEDAVDYIEKEGENAQS